MVVHGVQQGLSAELFDREFKMMILTDYHACWTLFADDKPIGFCYGFWLHRKVDKMVFNGFSWFPWSSPRSRIETAVRFFHKTRKETPMIGFVGMDEIEFFDVLKSHGVIRRVGTSWIMEGGSAVYETRWEN